MRPAVREPGEAKRPLWRVAAAEQAAATVVTVMVTVMTLPTEG
jgi:hypothetical protein